MLWQAFGRWGGIVSGSGDTPGPGVGSFVFDGSDDYIELASAPATAIPLTIACWMKSPTDVTRLIGGLYNFAGSAGFQLGKLSNPINDVTCYAFNSGTSGRANGGNFPLSTWCHVVGVFTNATSRAVYLNGASQGTNATNVTPAGLDRTLIGCGASSSSRNSFFNGRIAHFAIWNVALSGADITSLAGSALPSAIQPGNLVFYAKLTDGIAKDEISGNNLTVSGALSDPDGPL